MTFRPEFYPSDWKAISKRIRERDGNACKTCKAPNGEFISRHLAAKAFMLQDGRVFHEDDGRLLGSARGSEWEGGRAIKVVLTCAHLDHDTTNNADSNLAALCQLHHLRHDARQHAESARRTRRGRLADRDLFDAAKPNPTKGPTP